MQDVAEYRNEIVKSLLNARDADGNALLSEKQAMRLVGELSDGELEDGMMFNTPEEVAELLLDSGLE